LPSSKYHWLNAKSFQQCFCLIRQNRHSLFTKFTKFNMEVCIWHQKEKHCWSCFAIRRIRWITLNKGPAVRAGWRAMFVTEKQEFSAGRLAVEKGRLAGCRKGQASGMHNRVGQRAAEKSRPPGCTTDRADGLHINVGPSFFAALQPALFCSLPLRRKFMFFN